MSRLSVKSIAPLALGLGALACAALYFFIDPLSSKWIPKCVFHSITGWDCPGCGSQRMLHALLHGDFKGAWDANAFILIASPLLALMVFSASFRTRLPRLYRIVNSVPVIVAAGVAIIVWTLARNL